MSVMDDTIQSLRGLLFEQVRRLNVCDLRGLKEEIQRANAISHAAQTIINSAVAECTFMQITGSKGSGFMPITKNAPASEAPRLVANITNKETK